MNIGYTNQLALIYVLNHIKQQKELISEPCLVCVCVCIYIVYV